MINIKNKFQIFLFLILSNILYSQLVVKWELKENNEKAIIKIYNESKQNVIIPIDLKSFQAYFINIYNNSEWDKKYPFLAFKINVFDKISKNRVEINTSTPYLDISNFEKDRLKLDSITKNYESKINIWKKNNITLSNSEAQLNYYIIENLIYLKPNESLEFSILFDLRNITNQDNAIHYSYILEKNKSYTLFLSLHVKNDVYNYLTSYQKRKLKKYKLFTGSLESNKIELKQ
ncbi:hypothetical protein GCM10023210_03720 [Chryseobacterium ginsengisoli]|uniref:Uncharacterized protein n=1 Tax=Chryseobacterium ginsengisoli TaxID=363853 RepID=A0ABP9LVK7_9FLAO